METKNTEGEIGTLEKRTRRAVEIALASSLIDAIEESGSFENETVSNLGRDYIALYREDKKIGCNNRLIYHMVMTYFDKYGKKWKPKS